jgi:4'-phosphopantetheinyl transferase
VGVDAGTVSLGPALVAWAPARRLDNALPLAALSGPDLLRLDELAPDLRDRFVVGRLLIHALVAGLFPQATEWTVAAGPCRRCGRLHGGVELEGVPARASVSYAADLVVVAVAPTSRVSRLGVDIEFGSAENGRIEELRRMLGASTEPILRRWTRVGAVLKADGRGLLIDPGSVHLRRGGAWIAGAATTSYAVTEVPGPPGFLVSIAWCSVAPLGAVPAQTGRRMTGAAGARWTPRPLR